MKQVPSLDGVRGVAILLVLLLHFSKLVNWYPQQKAFAVGWVGVNLFFVLSGFLITGILLDAKGGQRYFSNFYARRTLRIFPLYFAFLALVLLLAPWFVSSPMLSALYREMPWYLTYLFNWRAASGGPPLGHLWSLSVEEQFYLAWPLLVYIASRRTLRMICSILIVGSFVFRVVAVGSGFPRFAYFATPACMEELAYGALGALLVREPRRIWWLNRALA
ncbi:MAG TPA: acyltransferase, partial [Terriglobales bacterium]|nr:acyltransferase [Terriglobales bacterium]